jgi:hypothetical protein
VNVIFEGKVNNGEIDGPIFTDLLLDFCGNMIMALLSVLYPLVFLNVESYIEG